MSTPFLRRTRWHIKWGSRPGNQNKWKHFPPMYPTVPYEKLMPALPPDVTVKRRREAHFQTMFKLGYDDHMSLAADKLTLLLKYERIELKKHHAEFIRGYAERLICNAIRYGDCHTATMELADFWLKEKGLIHKLFKVLVPRYSQYTTSFTALHVLPPRYADAASSKPSKKGEGWDKRYEYLRDPYQVRTEGSSYCWIERAVLELKGNPLPPLRPPPPNNRNLLTNILLDGARMDMSRERRDAAPRETKDTAPSEKTN